mgnify:CR=1 FL=1
MAIKYVFQASKPANPKDSELRKKFRRRDAKAVKTVKK